MSVERTSRTGKTYYLHGEVTKTGKPRHFFSTKQDGELADAIPDGFEIYENVNGQVFLRKKTAQLILPAELRLVEDTVHQFDDPWRYWVEVKKHAIVVYHADDTSGIYERLVPFGRVRMTDDDKRRFATYMAMLRFTLIDKKARAFVAERYCFRGSVDDWISIAGPAALSTHVRKFIKHLGNESFYELS